MAKPIRFKKEELEAERCGDPNSPSTCYWVPIGVFIDVPMQDWKFFPEYINSTYIQGGNIPENTIRIQFPELDLWTERKYKNVHFEIMALYQGDVADWLDFQSNQLTLNQFNKANIREANVKLVLKNLTHLPAGIHTANIIIKAYEVSGGQKTFIEQCPEPLKVVLNVKAGTVPQNPDFRERRITFHKDTWQLTGDTQIVLNNIDIDAISGVYPFNHHIVKEPSRTLLYISTEDGEDAVMAVLPKGVERREIVLSKNKQRVGQIPLLISVIDNETLRDFSVVPTEFDLSVSKTTNEIRTATAKIYNPQNLRISVKLAPSFLANVRIENGELRFETATLTDMPLGKYSGEIILISGSLEKRVAVNLRVVQTLVSDFRGAAYYFALDKNKVTMTRTSPTASYISLILELYYKGYGKEYRERQEYTHHYFNDQIELFPGEEVQDFFIRCQSLMADSLSLTAEYQYSLAIANIIIKEFNDNNEELSESRLNNIFFAPGRKPKCFPFFTDFGKRRVFEQSKIRLNTDILSENPALSGLFDQYDEPMPALEKKNEVFAFNFEKHRFSNASKTMITAGNLEFVPFPEPKGGKLIHLFFENQNLVLEWFSCPADYQRKFDFNHITDELTGEKFGALESENWVINTGWILREEIEFINALLKSRICFIVIGNQIIKARPMSKKNELYNTAENLYSMDLEFNIKQNER